MGGGGSGGGGRRIRCRRAVARQRQLHPQRRQCGCRRREPRDLPLSSQARSHRCPLLWLFSSSIALLLRIQRTASALAFASTSAASLGLAMAAAGGDGASNTLATLAKRKASDKVAAGASGPRGRWVHLVGEETVDESLEIYYCALCGAHCLILDVLVSELPARSSDHARVVALGSHATQLLLEEGPCVKIKRGGSAAAGLVEKQYRYLCKGCGLAVAYLSQPFQSGQNKFLYLMEGAFSLSNEGKTKAQLDAEEQEKLRLAPIVIPVFKKPATTAATAATPAAAASTTSSSAAPAAAAAPAATSSSASAAPSSSTPPASSSSTAATAPAAVASAAAAPTADATAAPTAAAAAPSASTPTEASKQ